MNHNPGGIIQVGSLGLFREGRTILKDISFSVRTGEMVGIIGPNGAGKTTLVRMILGLIRPTSGWIKVMGHSPGSLGHLRDLVGYVPQRSFLDRSVPLSVIDAVRMGAVTRSRMGQRFPSSLARKAEDSLRQVGIHGLRHQPFGSLSGGERQRAFLARALFKDPRILFLDEPNAGLDAPAQRRLFDILENLRRSLSVTVVVVSHDLAAITAVANRLICINQTMHVHGRPSEVLGSRGLENAYRCEFDLLSGGRVL